MDTVTFLDVKRHLVNELITAAEKRRIRVKLLLLDELRIRFIMPCVCNQRTDDAVVGLGKKRGIRSTWDP
jgi:hypothetical protein